MAVVKISFNSPEEATAFARGIEYANDCDVTVVECQDGDVLLEDETLDEMWADPT